MLDMVELQGWWLGVGKVRRNGEQLVFLSRPAPCFPILGLAGSRGASGHLSSEPQGPLSLTFEAEAHPGTVGDNRSLSRGPRTAPCSLYLRHCLTCQL